MRTAFCFLILLATMGAADAQKKELTLKDFEGIYELKSFLREGIEVPEVISKGVSSIEISKGVLKIIINEQERTAKLSLNALAKPMTLDLIPLNVNYQKDRKFLGICEFTDNTLTLLYSEDSPRPKTMDTNQGTIKLVLKRKP